MEEAEQEVKGQKGKRRQQGSKANKVFIFSQDECENNLIKKFPKCLLQKNIKYNRHLQKS